MWEEQMTECQKEILLALAACSLNMAAVSRKLYMHRKTVAYQVEKIKRETGLDPLNFYQLVKLLHRSGDHEQ